MSAFIPTNIFGGTLSFDTDEIKHEIKIYSDKKYVNELGDTMKGDLGMNNFIIKHVGDPVDDKDVVNKSYLNSELESKVKKSISSLTFTFDNEIKTIKDKLKNIYQLDSSTVKEELQMINDKLIRLTSGNNMIILHTIEKERRKDYNYILQKYKPNFWLSAMFPYSFAYYTHEAWDFKDLSNNGLKIVDVPELKMDVQHHIGIYFDSKCRIKSEYSFSNNFTFFIICRKNNTTGRLITGKWGNIVLGYWSNHSDVVHFNEFLSFGKIKEIFILFTCNVI